MRVPRLTEPLNRLNLGADSSVYASLLRQCTASKALVEGREVHVHLVNNGYEADTFLGNLLLQMYGSCGRVDEAIQVFSKLPSRNVFTWNLMFAVYAQNGYYDDARSLFLDSPIRDQVSWNAMLAMLGTLGCISEARDILHRMPMRDVAAWTSLLTAFARSGDLSASKQVFDSMEERNLVSWNVLAQGYSGSGDLDRAAEIVSRCPCVDVVTLTAMVSAYAQLGWIDQARELFDAMPLRNVVSWNAMLQGYAIDGRAGEARKLFDSMASRNVVSWTAIVAAYGRAGLVEEAQRAFDLTPERDLAGWNAMVATLAEHASVEMTWAVFDASPEKNVVGWTALIKASATRGLATLALRTFKLMDLEGIYPDDVALASVLDAAAGAASLPEGRAIHSAVLQSGGRFASNFVVSTALLNMYGKCGQLETARRIFEDMNCRSDVTWNAMMLSYAENGRGEEAIDLFRLLQLDGLEPDEASFVAVLSACSHSGLVNDGRAHLLSLVQDYPSVVNLQHYACVAHMLSRAGETTMLAC